MLRVIFKKDYELFLVGDGLIVIELVKEYLVDVVVLDICMLGMLGIEVFECLKFVDFNIEVVMMMVFEMVEIMK